jgi:hypothetical protein
VVELVGEHVVARLTGPEDGRDVLAQIEEHDRIEPPKTQIHVVVDVVRVTTQACGGRRERPEVVGEPAMTPELVDRNRRVVRPLSGLAHVRIDVEVVVTQVVEEIEALAVILVRDKVLDWSNQDSSHRTFIKRRA